MALVITTRIVGGFSKRSVRYPRAVTTLHRADCRTLKPSTKATPVSGDQSTTYYCKVCRPNEEA